MIRTLVVDDDYRVAELHCSYVSLVPGFVVVGKVHSGERALVEIDQLRPDLVLLDFYLPDTSGLEVLRRLREEDHHAVDVIAITAARDVQSLQSAIRGGVVHYLIKPFRLAAFQEKLTSYANAHARLVRIAQADQGEVDRIFGVLHPAPRNQLPKGISGATLDVILETLQHSKSGLTAASVAEVAGLSRVTARRYLDHLCRSGTVEVTMLYGGPGRPEHRYRLATVAAAGPRLDRASPHQ